MGRVLNPIVSESYMKGYIKDEGLIKPEGKITITENGTDIDVAQFRTADVAVSGGGTEITNPKLTISVDASGVAGDIGALPLLQFNDGSLQNVSAMVTGGSTYAFETYVLENFYPGEENRYFWDGNTAYPNILGYIGTLSVSNEVNVYVTLDKATTTFIATITDPTQPASFTLTVS